MDTFIFLEASLELVPAEIRNHSAVVSDAKRRRKKVSEILLDDSKHHSAMDRLKFREKRGRPDIVHQCLLLLLDSPMRNNYEIYVHTIGGMLVKVASETRLPRNYNRFVGLVEELFKEKVIKGDGKNLLEIVDLRLPALVKGKNVLLLSEKGEKFSSDILKGNLAICIGAFAHGDFFESTLKELGNFKAVSLGRESYSSLYVTSKILAEYERVRTS
ncbi:MAG: 16S rRNA methyltransferase [Archaeoglobaceae archaeon]|nr:16S rRNA methyltransferase [Archaeoglobaceae archaeon]MDW8118859.1 16S rRNA methyltransferase [Archaeoglobaceae archaeon]